MVFPIELLAIHTAVQHLSTAIFTSTEQSLSFAHDLGWNSHGHLSRLACLWWCKCFAIEFNRVKLFGVDFLLADHIAVGERFLSESNSLCVCSIQKFCRQQQVWTSQSVALPSHPQRISFFPGLSQVLKDIIRFPLVHFCDCLTLDVSVHSDRLLQIVA